MKWISYIMAFYMLLLAVFPCCQVDNCPDEKPATAQQADHQAGDQDDCGTCSPFFNCEGCASVSVVAETVHFNLPEWQLKAYFREYLSPVIPTINYDVWQPPQLG